LTSSNLLSDDVEYCTAMVREQARDLYLAALLLPKHIRPDILVLNAFHVEVTNATLSVREPLVGEIRLQWWADILAGRRKEEAAGHPPARALLHVLEHHNLPRLGLEAKLQAHVFDLYNDPMGNRATFEAWCGETRSVLYQMAVLIAGAEPGATVADASGHAGVASSIVSVLQNMAFHTANGRVFVPSDLLSAAGLSAQGFLGEAKEPHFAAIEALIGLGREHFAKATAAVSSLEADVQPVFLPLALAPLYFDQLSKNRQRIFHGLGPVSQLKRQWCLWRASRNGMR